MASNKRDATKRHKRHKTHEKEAGVHVPVSGWLPEIPFVLFAPFVADLIDEQ